MKCYQTDMWHIQHVWGSHIGRMAAILQCVNHNEMEVNNDLVFCWNGLLLSTGSLLTLLFLFVAASKSWWRNWIMNTVRAKMIWNTSESLWVLIGILNKHPPPLMWTVVFCVHVVHNPSQKLLFFSPCISAGKWEWLSDSPSLLPPCADAVSYYSQFGRIPGFTSGAGRRFRGILDEHLDLLLWPEGVKASMP